MVISTYSLSLTERHSISITYKIVSRDKISQRDKMGQNLQKSSSALLPVSSNISNTAICFCKGTHLSRIKRRNYGKTVVIHAFSFPFVPRLVMLETLVVCLSEKLLLMLEKSYSGQVSKLNLHKSHFPYFMCFSVFPFPVLELMTDGEWRRLSVSAREPYVIIATKESCLISA